MSKAANGSEEQIPGVNERIPGRGQTYLRGVRSLHAERTGRSQIRWGLSQKWWLGPFPSGVPVLAGASTTTRSKSMFHLSIDDRLARQHFRRRIPRLLLHDAVVDRFCDQFSESLQRCRTPIARLAKLSRSAITVIM